MTDSDAGITPGNQTATPDTPAGVRRTIGFEFHGETREYFRIWIVNIALTLLTLGVYSAWAKVRNHRYFYASTQLDGSPFDYTARPQQILRGRIIAVVLLVAYFCIEYFVPKLAAFAALVIVVLLPAVIVLSMRFRNINSLWRGVRFDFERNYRQSYLLFSPVIAYFGLIALMPYLLGVSVDDIIAAQNPAANADDLESVSARVAPYFMAVGVMILVATLMFPWWQKYYYRFIASNSRFGQSHFSFSAAAFEFYAIYLVALIVLAAAGLGVAFLFGVLTAIPGGQFILPLLVLLPFAAVLGYVYTKRTNVVYSNLALEDATVNCELSPAAMIGFYITNTLAIVFTLGLAVPWARIRVARYKASCFSLRGENLESFLQGTAANRSATGEEIGEVFGLDIGI